MHVQDFNSQFHTSNSIVNNHQLHKTVKRTHKRIHMQMHMHTYTIKTKWAKVSIEFTIKWSLIIMKIEVTTTTTTKYRNEMKWYEME